MDDSFVRIDAIKSLVKESIRFCSSAHKAVFDRKDTLAAVGYLNCASAKMSAAQALYYSRIEELEHYDIEELFTKFDTFCWELLRNVETGHSHQWTDIEYNALIDAFDASVCH